MPQRVTFRFPQPVDGVRYDIPPTEMPPSALSFAANVVYRRGHVGPRYGYATFASAVGTKVIAVRDYGVARGSVGLTGADGLVVMTTTGWKSYNAGSWTALTGAISSGTHGIFRIFPKNNANYIVGINNGIDIPKKWDTVAAGISDVGGSPPKPRAMMVLANRLLLFNLSSASGYTGVVSAAAYDVSAFNDFDSGWSTTLNGLLIDTPGDIVGALEMGDLQGAIYKSDAVVMAVAQDGTVPFHFEWKDIGDAGPCNSRCIFQVQDGSHMYLGTDGAVYRFDGIETRSIGDHVRKAILRRADRSLTNLQSKSFAFYDRGRNEAYFFFKPAGNAVIDCVIVSLSNLSAWPATFAFGNGTKDITAGGCIQVPGGTSGLRVALFQDETAGNSYVETDATYTDGGNNYAAQLKHGPTDFGVPGSWKTIDSVRHIFSSVEVDDTANFIGGSQTGGARIAGIDDSGNEVTGIESFQNISLGPNGAAPITDHRTTWLAAGPEYLIPPSGGLNGSFSYRGAVVNAFVRGER